MEHRVKLTPEEIAERNAIAQDIVMKIVEDMNRKEAERKQKQSELESNATNRLTKKSFDEAAIQAGFRPMDLNGYHYAVCDNYIVEWDGSFGPHPCVVGEYFGYMKPHANIGTSFKTLYHYFDEPPRPCDKYDFYSSEQVAQAFAKLSGLINEYLSKNKGFKSREWPPLHRD